MIANHASREHLQARLQIRADTAARPLTDTEKVRLADRMAALATGHRDYVSVCLEDVHLLSDIILAEFINHLDVKDAWALAWAANGEEVARCLEMAGANVVQNDEEFTAAPGPPLVAATMDSATG